MKTRVILTSFGASSFGEIRIRPSTLILCERGFSPPFQFGLPFAATLPGLRRYGTDGVGCRLPLQGVTTGSTDGTHRICEAKTDNAPPRAGYDC